MIRLAKCEDVIQIAQVHVLSWNETYTGMIRQEILDQLDINEKIKLWELVINDQNQRVYVYEEDQKILGFANFFFNANTKNGEIRAIYLLKQVQGKGVGFNMIKKGISLFEEMECYQINLEVFDQNPSRYFYEKLGAKCIAQESAQEYGSGLNILHYKLNIKSK